MLGKDSGIFENGSEICMVHENDYHDKKYYIVEHFKSLDEAMLSFIERDNENEELTFER